MRGSNRKQHSPVSPFKASEPTSSGESIAIRDVTKYTPVPPFEAQIEVKAKPGPKYPQARANNASHQPFENAETSVVGPSSIVPYPIAHPGPLRVTLTTPYQELHNYTAPIRKPSHAEAITLNPKDSILVALKPVLQGHEPSRDPYGKASLTRNLPHEGHINFSLSTPPFIIRHHPSFDTDAGRWQNNIAPSVVFEGTDIVAVSPYQTRPPAGANVNNSRKSSRQESADDAEKQRGANKRHRRNGDGAGGRSGRTPGGGGNSSGGGGGGGGHGGGGGTGSLNEARGANGRQFACPYYKLDRVKYQACLFRQSLKGTNYVKQHLARCHGPHYCPTCGELFSQEGHWNDHIRDGGCEPREFTLDGMTAEQKQGLDTLSRGGNEVERWFRLWDHLFPNTPRPSTPYLDDIHVEVLALVVRGWAEKGGLEQVLSAHLGSVAEDQMQGIRRDVCEGVENYTRELLNQGREDVSTVQDHSLAMIPSQSASSSAFEVLSESHSYPRQAGSQEAARYPPSEAHSSGRPGSQLVSPTSHYQGYNLRPDVGPPMFFQGHGSGGYGGHGNAHSHVGITASQGVPVTSHFGPNNMNPIGALPSQPRNYGVGYEGQGNAHAFHVQASAQASAQGFQAVPSFLEEDWGPLPQGDDIDIGPVFEPGNDLNLYNFGAGLGGFQGLVGDVFEDEQDAQDHS